LIIYLDTVLFFDQKFIFIVLTALFYYVSIKF